MASEDPAEPQIDLEKPAREITKGVLEGIRDWWRGRVDGAEHSEPERGILILGPGGTGKTTLARFLSADPYWFDESPGKYAESVDLDYFALADDADVELVVAPGQHYRRTSTWPGLLAQVAAGEFRGIILMNAYGYHTFSTPSYQNHQLYQSSKPEFLKAFYADRRDDELRVLRQLVPHISICPKPIWLLSLVTKQDLWGSQQRDVEEHYLRGEYSAAVQGIAQALGNRSFRHDTVFLSLIIRNLETLAGERLQPNEAGYDMRHLRESLQRLVTALTGLQGWEGQ